MQAEDKFLALASHKRETETSEPVQSIVKSIVASALKAAPGENRSVEDYCRMVIDLYSNDYLSQIADAKYGEGSSAYIVKAFRFYLENSPKL